MPATSPAPVADHPDQHLPPGLRAPLRPDAFAESDDQKISAIAGHFRAIMQELGLDLTDDSSGRHPAPGGQNVRAGVV
ncbi:MAG: hypothetical protein WKG07_48885 [Hymenobacter sp.]